jgi:hypothetical protein
MSGDLKYRLSGLLSLALAAGVLWYFILVPLEQARAQMPHVNYSIKAFVLIGFAAVFGVFFMLFGGSVPYRNVEKKTATPAGWVLLVLSAALSGAGFWWADRQFTQLGYAYPGASPSHAPAVTPFVFPSPPPMAPRPTFAAPAER